MKTGRVRNLSELSNEVLRQKELKRDLLVNTRSLEYQVDVSGQRMNIIDRLTGIKRLEMPVNDIAHRQLGTFLNIPAKYYDTMREQNPELLANNINSWMQVREPQQRMVRTLAGNMRAFLSDSYRMFDNEQLVEMVLPILSKLGQDAQVESCEITQQRMYIKVVNKRVQAEVSKGDIVQAGVIISNSEVGLGAINVQPLVYRLVCSNGMVINEAATRSNHRGRRITSDDDYTVFKQDTIDADNLALSLKIRDRVDEAVSQVTLDKVVQKYRMAKEKEITGDIPTLIDITARDFKLNQDEKNGVLKQLCEDRDYSLYGLANAVTKVSQFVPDYDRATELETVGYDILKINQKQWKNMNEKESLLAA